MLSQDGAKRFLWGQILPNSTGPDVKCKHFNLNKNQMVFLCSSVNHRNSLEEKTHVSVNQENFQHKKFYITPHQWEVGSSVV
jgi:hypothetical protein